MAIQDQLASAIKNYRAGGVGYGQELMGQANPAVGKYQYGKGPSTYSNIRPGTKTKALLEAEKAAREALEQKQSQLQASMVPLTGGNNSLSKLPASGANGTLQGWLSEALRLTGQDQSLLPYLETIAMKESSGDPRAINEWDSNWKAGHPSKGLLQTIDSTFNAHKLPGHDDIWNPVDNAAAAIRYAISRYGSLQNVPGIKSMAKGGKYVGY